MAKLQDAAYLTAGEERWLTDADNEDDDERQKAVATEFHGKSSNQIFMVSREFYKAATPMMFEVRLCTLHEGLRCSFLSLICAFRN